MSMETIEVQCRSCGEMKQVVCDPQDMQKWKDGEGYIQDVLHYLSAGDRELLLSSTCDDCFQKMFGSSEDHEDEDDEEDWSFEDEEDDDDEDDDVFEEDDDDDDELDDDDDDEDWSFEDDDDQEEGLLDLTHSEQNIMSEVCSIISSFLMNAEPTEEAYAELGEKISLATDGCSSQFFGTLYDKFHRSGKNK